MKKTLLLSLFAGFTLIAMLAFAPTEKFSTPEGDELNLGFPEDVQTVLETSCFDCHTAGSKNDDAKKELNFSEWVNYDDAKKISKLTDICEEITEGEMPKKKYLEYYPDRKLDADQLTLLCNWTEEEANKLMGE